jgi:hypothetical protein
MRFERTEEEYKQVVEEAKIASRLELADERLWLPLKSRYVDLARRFVAFEKDLRSRFPETHTIGREFEIAGFLRPSSGEMVRDTEVGALKFVGRIDRVDSDSRGQIALYDYKSSAASASQFGGWLKKNKIQLLLYSMAFENGLTALDPRPVVAALYYVARPLNRDYGFKVDGVEQGLYDLDDRRKKNRITVEGKENLYKEGRELVKSAVQGILAGRFEPSPRDREQCGDCIWNALCRAPHLTP